MRSQLLVRVLVFALIVVGLYGLLRSKRAELVDFMVPRTAAERFLAAEPLYRPEDGHYQYKYLPAFALAMAPFTWMPKEAANFIWFTLTAAMAWTLVMGSIAALPDRRMAVRKLFWLTLLLNGKFLVRELVFGQFNLLTALMLLAAIIAAQRGLVRTPGVLVALGVFVKPYALVLLPWLAWRLGWRALLVFGIVFAAGLLMPIAFYGWHGNLTLLYDWYRTVSETTAPNLMGPENISFASTWAKLVTAGPTATALAAASSIAVVAVGMLLMAWWRSPSDPYYLDAAYFLLFVPLLSPQGWDYVLVIGLPAFVLLVDRWPELSPPWRAAMVLGFVLTSFIIFDLQGRWLYALLTGVGAVTWGVVLLAAGLIQLRSRALA